MKKNITGFSLIELIIAMTIIGILTTGLLVTINPLTQIQKANDAKRKSDLALVQRALEQYFNDNGFYPGGSGTIAGATWGGRWAIIGVTTYMDILPKDPVGGKNYYYRQAFGGQGYIIYASLDRAGDTQKCTSGGPGVCATLTQGLPYGLPVPPPDACGASFTCDYAVSSTNIKP